MTMTVEVFDPIPSWRATAEIEVRSIAAAVDVVRGEPVASTGPAAGSALHWSQAELRTAGMDGAIGQALVIGGGRGTSSAHDGSSSPVVIAYGVGELADLTTGQLRTAVAAFARASLRSPVVALTLPANGNPGAAAQAAVEGVLLARYSYRNLRSDPAAGELSRLILLVPQADVEAAKAGARRGLAYARATMLARDLANSPPSLLTAERLATCAEELGGGAGLAVEVFDEKALIDLGCGGLLGVNAGSTDPPRMVRLRYEPAGATARITLVGKGIMYDSGGIALKPADAVHATMKNDMSGAGAILAAMAMLAELDCRIAVVGYLMCTDNMPSGSATKLGDVLTIRGGTTVEVINTDAEGRLVMADALVLAAEQPTDAIIDIATLTGACLRALGAQIAGVFGNDQSLVDKVLAAADRVDEPAWQLPLARRYRGELNSDVADLRNMGGPNAAAIHAALFLEEFVAGRPWAHIDIAGTAQSDSANGWQSAGCTGFGARLLLDLALSYEPAPANEPALAREPALAPEPARARQ